MSTPEEARLFVAVDLDDSVREVLGALQDELRRPGLTGLRWVRPEGVHLTLKFLGETPVTKIGEIEQALAGAAQAVAAHTLSLGKLGTFGGRQSPRVLWLDLRGDVSALHRLQQAVEKALAPLGFPAEDRSFSPHLTLARIRPEDAREAARALNEGLHAVHVPVTEIRVSEISLMRSKLGPGGAVYTRLWAGPLAA